ncbi:MAG: hypothetical protein JSV02_00115 [Dehalococcoidia bacterium]|nr:MAG: hypothetical protein JSV02_00115 [Dehalococcoidia bacterium]
MGDGQRQPKSIIAKVGDKRSEDLAARIGEVIEASTGSFVAECYDLHSPPPLGSLVRTSDSEVDIFGVVCHASTESIDPGRRPVARGRDEHDEENIYRQHPQLSRLLRTTFETLAVGHRQGDNIYRYLPPRPPRVHGFVYLCEPDDVRRFTASLDFLTILLGAKEVTADEVISACLRLASCAYDDSRAFLVGAGKELAILLSSDLNRLNSVLRRIRQ